MRILLVEDDEILSEILTRRLIDYCYTVDAVKDGEAGWSYASTYDYDLLVLDVMLPQLDGISLCQQLRAAGHTIPILLLTAKDNSVTKIEGLDAGADDYVVKPFNEAELIARIRALLRRSHSNPLPVLIWGDLCLNSSTNEVTYRHEPLTLTAKEYALLELFLQESQHVFSNEEILESLWSSEEFPAEATIRSHVRRLRLKLSTAGAPPDLITTVHGRGYYLKPLSTNNHPAPACEVPESLPNLQTEYLDFLNQTWANTQDKCLQQVNHLLTSIDSFSNRIPNSEQQAEAYRIAHQLVGTLGTFELKQAMQCARELEQGLHSQTEWTSDLIQHLQTEVRNLQRAIITTSTIPSLSEHPTSSLHSCWVLIVDYDPIFTAALVKIAKQAGLHPVSVETIRAAQDWLADNVSQTGSYQSGALILRLPDATLGQTESVTRSMSLEFLQSAHQRYPSLPTVILSRSTDLSHRLELVRYGGRCLLPHFSPPEHVMGAITQQIQTLQQSQMTRILIVDDDPNLLRLLPALLKPWGFEVSTLDQPLQFWSVLEAIQPDLLILDLQMPDANGLELCQILRCDPDWQQLPVMFLSILADLQTQHQAFAAGADDYLCKPITGVDLAHRIINRLQRVRTCTR
jgi:DNA-binding response OmpR family regulator/HPt (histidine-containing phosphotransfer) domain-containing protein